ncbi:glycosyl transferase family 9 [Pseudarthrobacter chlorophenolicus A6]|uniref:Glycosyl transferase family 9 n=1 Tax=Pseudarthrobacter chlorophenolicus (strain ATCC 700700 / DSM 12829 / CIP 107037 / JCM 12360 / KCTC 9906 / NCIMB 13794 / A6) TaxID=452863 RepID=B8H8J7_PSECP|nr:glycosyltransferase family 9 protein [Pseudarthrobacter chlorophenolicus]ACL39875.1 glycosyl transferase family 9 [Pseudarthrobacter chlorophenolicus A6]SDQ92111.1 ADP-heptose:LPS heptosyltransferase [Pseudarthrobacter chlorophenolicus]
MTGGAVPADAEGSGKGERPELLVLRALKLGDLLVAVPALKAIRRAFPEHRLRYAAQGWLSEALGLVGGYELLPTHGLDQPLALGPGVVDVAVNLHGNGPESAGRIEALKARRTIAYRGGNLEGPPWRPELHERDRWAHLLSWHGIDADPTDLRLERPRVPNPVPGATVVHVGAAYGSRLWPAERFAAVAAELARAGHRVVFTGGEGEKDRAYAVCRLAGLTADTVLAGSLGLAGFAAVIAGARVVVSADTGAAHLASAYGTPSVVLFGPAPPEIWGPPPGPHVVLTQAGLRRGDTFSDVPDPALLAVEVDDVMAAVAGLGLLPA